MVLKRSRTGRTASWLLAAAQLLLLLAAVPSVTAKGSGGKVKVGTNGMGQTAVQC